MTTARKVTRKTTAAKKKVQPTMPKTVEVKVEVTVWVDAPLNDERTIGEFRDDIRKSLMDPNGDVRAKRVTDAGGYYIVDGRVCLPDDYDVEKRTFKPGTHPPMWAMSSDEREIQKRIDKEKSLPALARNPQGLRTTQETDAHNTQESRRNKTAAVLHDLNENSEWGKKKKAELEAARIAKEEADELKSLKSASAFEEDEDEFEDDEEEPFFDEDEEDEDEAEWDEEDPFDDDTADEVLEEQTSSVLDRLRGTKTNGAKVVRKKVTVTIPKPATRRVVKRR